MHGAIIRFWQAATLGLFLAALALSAIMNGAVVQPYTGLAALSLAVPAFMMVGVPKLTGGRATVMRNVTLLAAAFFSFGMVQISPVPLGVAHPAWQTLPAEMGVDRGYISVNPEKTVLALLRTALPVLAFLTALGLANSDAAARRLWGALAGLGGAVLLLGAALEVIAPDMRVFATQPVGGAPFNGVFVNRNTTAAFAVVVLFAVAGTLVMRVAHKERDRDQRALAMAWRGGALLLCAVAIVATASKAGGFLGLTVFAGTIAVMQVMRKRPQTRGRMRFGVGVAIAIVTLLILVIFYAAFGNPVLARLDALNEGTRRCLWQLSFEAWRAQPILGAGLGTFEDVFPAFRTPFCPTGGLGSVVLHAHNSWLEWGLGLGWLAPVFVFLLGAQFWHICRLGLRNRRRLRGIPILMMGLALYLVAHSFVDFPLQIPGMAAYAAAVFGAGAAICLHQPSGRGRSRRRKPQGVSQRASNRPLGELAFNREHMGGSSRDM